jgi:arsenite methyltransferase
MRCASRSAASTVGRRRPRRRLPLPHRPALASRLGYEAGVLGALPDQAAGSFAGVGNPFSLRRLAPGEKVVDVGSGAGFGSFIAAGQAGPGGQVAGVDMAPGMLARSRQTAQALSPGQVQFREGFAAVLVA